MSLGAQWAKKMLNGTLGGHAKVATPVTPITVPAPSGRVPTPPPVPPSCDTVPSYGGYFANVDDTDQTMTTPSTFPGSNHYLSLGLFPSAPIITSSAFGSLLYTSTTTGGAFGAAWMGVRQTDTNPPVSDVWRAASGEWGYVLAWVWPTTSAPAWSAFTAVSSSGGLVTWVSSNTVTFTVPAGTCPGYFIIIIYDADFDVTAGGPDYGTGGHDPVYMSSGAADYGSGQVAFTAPGGMAAGTFGVSGTSTFVAPQGIIHRVIYVKLRS